MTKVLSLQEHLKTIAPKGWEGKVAKHGLAAAKRRQGRYAKAYWLGQRKLKKVKKTSKRAAK